jgi:hypothetical protein
MSMTIYLAGTVRTARILLALAIGMDDSPSRRVIVRIGTGRGIMIRNGLYHCRTTFLDGVAGGSDGVMVLRDGILRGGDSFYYCYGTYACANGKVKGEITNQEHTASHGERPVWEKRVVTMGYTGTYDDETIESYGTSLVGKQSIRFRANLRLLIPD